MPSSSAARVAVVPGSVQLVGSYNDLVELMALAAQLRVTLHTAKYALDDVQQAVDDLSAGRVRGRAILVP